MDKLGTALIIAFATDAVIARLANNKKPINKIEKKVNITKHVDGITKDSNPLKNL
jgi:hypothetical protein